MADSPRQQVTGVTVNGVTFNWKRVEVNDSAKTWVMFKSNTANSIWVPLNSASWSWSAVGQKNENGVWEVLNSTAPTPTLIPNTEFPTWTRNVRDVPYQAE